MSIKEIATLWHFGAGGGYYVFSIELAGSQPDIESTKRYSTQRKALLAGKRFAKAAGWKTEESEI